MTFARKFRRHGVAYQNAYPTRIPGVVHPGQIQSVSINGREFPGMVDVSVNRTVSVHKGRSVGFSEGVLEMALNAMKGAL